MPIDNVSLQDIARVAQGVWGSQARVASVREIRPVYEHDIARVAGCTSNLSYIVALVGDPQPYVLRFNRGYKEDLYAREAETYRLIAEHTDVPVPRVHCVDSSRKLLPTGYMVMDYMPGEESFYLTHPDNPHTDRQEKIEIMRQVGRYYAQVHAISRRAEPPDGPLQRMLYRLEQLAHVVQDGRFALDPRQIARCRRVVEGEPYLRLAEESVCVSDAELHFQKQGGSWRVSFICDVEWVDFGDPYLDLVTLACAPRRLYELDHPLRLDDVEQARNNPFLAGYETLRAIDYQRLSRLALYYHLAVMCSFTDQVYRPEKRPHMRSREPLYRELVDAVAVLSPTEEGR